MGRWAPARTATSAGARWWNVKHPARYAALLAAGGSPEAGREVLTDAERHTERVMLRLRLASGLPLALLDADGRRGRGARGRRRAAGRRTALARRPRGA